MGELKKGDAEYKRDSYVTKLESVKRKVREDFSEMDFENAKQRDTMEIAVIDIETELGNMINTLNGMTFE